MGRLVATTLIGMAIAGVSSPGAAQSAPNERPCDHERLEFAYPTSETLRVRCVREERAGHLSPACRRFKAEVRRALQRQ